MAGEMCTFKWQGKSERLNGQRRLNGKTKMYV